MSYVTETTKKQLIGLSHNECNHPDCERLLVEFDLPSNTASIVGDAAHIHDNNPHTARYKADLTDEKKSHFDNLLMLCKKDHKIVDGKEASKYYTADMLRGWKVDHMEKVSKRRDRNWICHPNSISSFESGRSITVKYWIDREGREQIYTPQQLAVVEQLQPLTISFTQLHGLLSMLDEASGEPSDPSYQTMNDGYMRQLKSQADRLPKVEDCWLGYFTETLQVAQDVTLGELLAMMAQDGLAKKAEMRAMGDRKRAERERTAQPVITRKVKDD